MSITVTPLTHPLLQATAVIDDALTEVAEVNPSFMPSDDKATALLELARIEARVKELKLRVLADAPDVAEQTAARDAAAWLAQASHDRLGDVRADLRLAEAIDRRYGVLGRAMRDGRALAAQARVIVKALDQLPAEVGRDVIALAEEALVGYCDRFDPTQLARLGERILDHVAPEIADEAEAKRLRDLERSSKRKTKLVLRRLGDGTTRVSGLIPDHVAKRLATYLEAFANPRKHPDGVPADDAADAFLKLPYPRRLGEALCQLLESLDPRRLPVHGGDATTVVVTITLDDLRRELGAADLLGSDLPGETAPDRLSAAETRRLACTAHVIPAVLGGDSEVLDLGRSRRLFSPAQRRALLLRDRTCRAEGCDIPGTWSEAHHLLSWQQGGATDLDNAVLLCSYHHHAAHDPGYGVERMPNGDLRYHRRR